MKILVDENMPYAQALFSRLGEVEVVNGRQITAQNILAADALIVRSVTRVDQSLLDGSLVQFVGTATAGIDHIDQTWLEQAGIRFSSAPGCNAIAVVEYVFSALLWLAQRDGFDLRDKIVGIIGVGNVGSLLHQRLYTFGVPTLLCDPPQAEAGAIGDWKPMAKLVAEADILTLHTPLTYHGPHTTWHLVNDEMLSALPSAKRILINTCRGAVVDNAALLRALKGGKLLTVVLDVWESEPELLLPLLARVDIGTAHIAGYSLEGKVRGSIQVYNAYSAFLGAGERIDLSDLLPAPKLERVRWRGAIDEEALRRLAHLVYDLRYDDMLLRRTICLPRGFDQLRKSYFDRREWSSLYVDTDNSVSADKLTKLGFYAIYNNN
ncbi:4-phosphoerythronate dehydrogenase [Candidatus Palibaumannia cicadellinicola]|uniref:Erythronate-4-phosphate dehydrogenase n=1 Tax=Candidatus Palibaumannia cicadellinicola TaxID=186490 RepID=A0A2N4XXH5_9GAMM|nr:4-phosphoerythronate dehydrogenase [Candidatus Baumannia cicadellinicola]PLK59203.1 4-phosphoerythronate dehydrogenase [Candidatus Baumannia cicadellinicola]